MMIEELTYIIFRCDGCFKGLYQETYKDKTDGPLGDTQSRYSGGSHITLFERGVDAARCAHQLGWEIYGQHATCKECLTDPTNAVIRSKEVEIR